MTRHFEAGGEGQCAPADRLGHASGLHCTLAGHGPSGTTTRQMGAIHYVEGAFGALRIQHHACRRRETPAWRFQCRGRRSSVPRASPPLVTRLSRTLQPFWLMQAALERGGSISLLPFRVPQGQGHIRPMAPEHRQAIQLRPAGDASDLLPTTRHIILVRAASSSSYDADQRGSPIVTLGKHARIAQTHVVGASSGASPAPTPDECHHPEASLAAHTPGQYRRWCLWWFRRGGQAVKPWVCVTRTTPQSRWPSHIRGQTTVQTGVDRPHRVSAGTVGVGVFS